MAFLGLETLPNEILGNIIIFLDPVALIALAQSSQFFRSLICPAKEHFVQRLLCLELMPEFGGGSPDFRLAASSTNHALDEPDSWKGVKFACCSCVKLLHHLHFDNHSLLRLGLRKPKPGSREANRLTIWDPVHPDGRARSRRKALGELERIELQTFAIHYTVAAQGRDIPVPTRDEYEQEGERELCGRSRSLRLCNECRWQRGDWSRKFVHSPTWHDDRGWPNIGTPEIPIVRSRRLRRVDLLDAFFPGLFEELPIQHRPQAFKATSTNLDRRLFSMHTARCPSCHKWRLLSAFRVFLFRHARPSDMIVDSDIEIEPDNPFHKPRSFDEMRCNHCLARDFGREKFTDIFVKTFLEMMKEHATEFKKNWLNLGWGHLARRPGYRKFPPKFKAVFAGMPLTKKEGPQGQQYFDLQQCDPEELRQRVQSFRHLMETEGVEAAKTNPALRGLGDWVTIWYTNYERMEMYLELLWRSIRKVEEDPTGLIDYVLNNEFGVALDHI